MIDNTNESDALIEMSPISNIKLENKFFSQDYKENEYNYLIFNTMSTVDKAVSTLNSWTEISSLNVIIRFDRGLFKLQKKQHLFEFLFVSVTGGAGRFFLPSRIKTAFKDGIAKIAVSTNALIITGNFIYN